MTTAAVHQYSATVKGGFWPGNSVSTLTNTTGRGALRRRVAQALSRPGMRALQELLVTLNGATPAVAASKTHTRIAASSELGGVRTVETVTDIDVNTAAGDITIVNADLLTFGSFQTSPPANGDGNPLGLPGL